MATVTFAAVRLLPSVAHRIRDAQWVAPGAAIVGIVLCVPTCAVPVGVARAPGSMAVRSIVEQVDDSIISEAVFEPSGMWIGEPYSVPVFATLLANNQPIRVSPDVAAQYSYDRAAKGDVALRLSSRNGAAVTKPWRSD